MSDFAVFGGPQAIKVWPRGDLVCSLEIVNNQESLCIWRARRSPTDGVMVIGVHCLGHYFDSTGLPSQDGMARVEQAKQILGFSPLDTFSSRKILDAIYESIHDLIHTRPAAPKGIDLSGVERVTLKADGDTILDL